MCVCVCSCQKRCGGSGLIGVNSPSVCVSQQTGSLAETCPATGEAGGESPSSTFSHTPLISTADIHTVHTVGHTAAVWNDLWSVTQRMKGDTHWIHVHRAVIVGFWLCLKCFSPPSKSTNLLFVFWLILLSEQCCPLLVAEELPVLPVGERVWQSPGLAWIEWMNNQWCYPTCVQVPLIFLPHMFSRETHSEERKNYHNTKSSKEFNFTVSKKNYRCLDTLTGRTLLLLL